MKRICIITTGFPTPIEPAKYPFVDQLVCAWCDLGYEVSVICPVPHFVGKERFYQSEWIRKTLNGNEFRVFHPRYFSFADKRILGIRTAEVAFYSSKKAIMDTIKRNHIRPDVLYSHFLPSGCLAGSIGDELGIPSFCAFGESSLWSIKPYKFENVQKRLSYLTGIVSVATENKRVLVRNHLFREEDIGVFPNAADHNVFCPRDKKAMREKLGVPTDAVVGIYTGAFTKAKGALRVQKAAARIPSLKMVYLGGGPEEPCGDNIVFKGKIPHDLIPEWLCTADFFVLPTLQEGCCNAIVEAMSCGLPIISSDLPFNDDIVDKDMALLVDPMDVDAIYQAMNTMTNNETFRYACAEKSLERSKGLDIVKRANNIAAFMMEKS